MMDTKAPSSTQASDSPQVSPAVLERRARFWSRIFLTTLSLTFPATAILLWLLTYLPLWPRDLDVHGLIAVSVGILGILVFFIFLYKYQMLATRTRRARIVAMIVHGAIVLALFLMMIWLGYDSPWSERALWGDYNLHEAIKSWVIAVIVFGSITFLGSLFDFVRKRLAGEYPDS